MENESFTALITAIVAACAFLIASLLRISKKVDRLVKTKA
jgi:hypothetical protein